MFLKSNKTFHVNLSDLQQKSRIHFLYEKPMKIFVDVGRISPANKQESSGVKMGIYNKNPFLELRLANYFILPLFYGFKAAAIIMVPCNEAKGRGD
jgi:hypothetical protein